MNYLGNKHMNSWIEHMNRWTDDNNNFQRTLGELQHKKTSELIQENRHSIKENNYKQILELVENVTQKLNSGFERHMINLRYNYEKVHGLIQILDFNFIIRHVIGNVFVLATKYMSVHYEKLDRLFRKYNFVWFEFISLDEKLI